MYFIVYVCWCIKDIIYALLFGFFISSNSPFSFRGNFAYVFSMLRRLGFGTSAVPGAVAPRRSPITELLPELPVDIFP